MYSKIQKITNVYQNIKLYVGQQARHNRIGSFSFVQLWTAKNCNIIPAECVVEFLGNHPTKHKRHLKIIS